MNGKNPLVMLAERIRFPMPYEDAAEQGELPDVDAVEWEEELPEAMSEDEQVNGVNMPPPDPNRRRRLPPMPRVPKGEDIEDLNVWHPPFEVLPDGTVVGVPMAAEGSPPGDEVPIAILPDGTREPFNPPKGSMEASAQMFQAPGSR